mmetsp:Transcript_31820/g.58576  ORF Transcript_31820/g.58576 Transcript_31820/m.58576 type:complete len:206 (+) Transcript_31820:608-1225(+)
MGELAAAANEFSDARSRHEVRSLRQAANVSQPTRSAQVQMMWVKDRGVSNVVQSLASFTLSPGPLGGPNNFRVNSCVCQTSRKAVLSRSLKTVPKIIAKSCPATRNRHRCSQRVRGGICLSTLMFSSLEAATLGLRLSRTIRTPPRTVWPLPHLGAASAARSRMPQSFIAMLMDACATGQNSSTILPEATRSAIIKQARTMDSHG